MCPTPSYHDARAVPQVSSTCSAIEGRTIVSARPWLTSTGAESPDRTSSASISRASSAPLTCGGTTMFQHSAALQSSAPSGCAVHARRKRRMAVMLVGRSESQASPAFARKSGPMSSKAVERGVPDDGREVVGPQARVEVARGVGRLLRHAVAPEVEGDHVKVVRERAPRLPEPALLALGPAVDEDDRRAGRHAPLPHVQLESAAAAYLVRRERLAHLRRVDAERVHYLCASFRSV